MSLTIEDVPAGLRRRDPTVVEALRFLADDELRRQLVYLAIEDYERDHHKAPDPQQLVGILDRRFGLQMCGKTAKRYLTEWAHH